MNWTSVLQVIGRQQHSALAGIEPIHHAVGPLPSSQLGQQSPPPWDRAGPGAATVGATVGTVTQRAADAP